MEFVLGDVRDAHAVDRALRGVDFVFHKAAAVGVAQSMYEIRAYTDINSMGTAIFLETLVNKHRDHIQKMIVASSMSIYGEGKYIDPQTGQPVVPAPRTQAQLEAGQWDPFVPGTDRVAQAVPCDETKPLAPTSVYAIGKRDQEEMFLAVGDAYKIPAVAFALLQCLWTAPGALEPLHGRGGHLLLVFPERPCPAHF